MKDKQEKWHRNFFFKFIFCENIHRRQSQEYRIFGFVRYLPTPELEIFAGIVHWRQSQEHERKNKKGKKENKFLAILDKTSNAACLR
jgi:hypothetical protein